MASSSNIAPPVPTASGSSAGNGTLETSVDGSPEVISQEEVPGGAREPEVATHTGALSPLDEYIRMHFVALAFLTWSTAQISGTLLWTIPIHPSYFNEIVNHLYKLFNCWTGGMDFKIKICGTGFHAGMLCLVRLPPNVEPKTIRTPQQMTIFPHLLIDAKQLEMVSRSVVDQIDRFFHYSKYDPQDPSTFGGHVCLFVFQPLVASSTGASQVNISVLGKLSADFCFNQIIPPSIITVNTATTLSECKLYLPDNPVDVYSREFFSIFRITSNTTAAALTHHGDHMFRLDGVNAMTHPTVSNDHCDEPGNSFVAFADTTTGTPIADGCISRRDYIKYGALGPKIESPLFLQQAIVSNFRDANHQLCNAPVVQPNVYAHTISTTTEFGTIYAPDVYRTIDQGPTFQPPLVPPNNESFCQWVWKAPAVDVPSEVLFLQSYDTRDIIKKLTAPISPGQAILFTVTDKLLNIPLFHLKLHFGGFMTTNANPNNIDFDPAVLSFEPVSVIQATDPIPAKNSMNIVTSRMARKLGL
jgi:hypothetical protein